MSIEKESFLKDIRQEELHVVDFMKVSKRRFSYEKLFICQKKFLGQKSGLDLRRCTDLETHSTTIPE